MGIVSRIKAMALGLNDEKAWNPSLWRLIGSQSLTGEVVNEDTALTYSAVWNAVTLISGTIASLPLHLMVQRGEKTVSYTHLRYSRAIEKELVQWDVWTEWLSKVPGIGAWTAAKLIILFNYKFVPVCKECGGEFEKTEKETQGKLINVLTCVDCGRVAKDGVLKHKVVRRDFPTVSKWWAYMGLSLIHI